MDTKDENLQISNIELIFSRDDVRVLSGLKIRVVVSFEMSSRCHL